MKDNVKRLEDFNNASKDGPYISIPTPAVIIMLLIWLMCIGDPDLLDAIIKYLFTLSK